ncbi:type II secretion system protein N [Nitrospira moscoviensis]|nr:type II secretion system protein N [Nitrospira moscoviensis]
MTYRTAALAVIGAISCWLIAHSVNGYVAYTLSSIPSDSLTKDASPAPDAPSALEPQEMAKSILSSGLFVVPPDVSSITAEAQEAPPTPPIELKGKLKLLGTAIVNGRRSSAAIEQLSDHTQKLYFLEDTIEGFGQLAGITREGVTIVEGNRRGYLPLADESAKPVPISIAAPVPRRPNAPTLIDRRQLKETLSDVSKLLTEARAMPYYNLENSGKLEGWQLIEIKPKSILDQLGIQQRDVMLRINGTPVTDPGTMLRLLQELQHERLVKLDLIRGGDRQTLSYEIR